MVRITFSGNSKSIGLVLRYCFTRSSTCFTHIFFSLDDGLRPYASKKACSTCLLTLRDSRARRAAICNAESYAFWLLNRANTCGVTVVASRRSHDIFELAALKTSNNG